MTNKVMKRLKEISDRQGWKKQKLKTIRGQILNGMTEQEAWKLLEKLNK